MDTLATLGFKADTNDLVKADKALDNLEKSAAATESQVKQTNSAMSSMGAAAAAQSSGVMKMIASLDDQVATLGMTNKELLLYRAAQQGATNADKQAIVAAVNKIEAFERMTLATRNQAVAADVMGKSVGNNRGIMQSFGYQLQDTIVQAQMGANAFMILSQQGSQMASAFGPSGAVIGALIAVAGVAGMVLAPSLMDSKTEAEKLTSAMDALGESATRNENGILELTNEIKELAKQSELAANAQLQAVMIKSAEAIKLASKATAEMIDELTGAGYGLYDVADAMKELDTAFGYFGSGRSKAFTETITEIGEKFGQTGAAAEKLGLDVLTAVKAMSEAKTPEGINQAREAILRIGSEAKLSDKELASFIMTVNKFASEGITAAETAALMAKSIEDGSIATSSATDKLTELTQQTALAREEFLYGEAAAQKLALAFELGLKPASEFTKEIYAQVDELIKWQKAGKDVEEQLKRIAKLEDEAQAIFEAEEELIEIDKERIKTKEELIEKVLGESEAYEETASKVATISEKAAERIESAFADAWMNAFDGFESVVDGMKNAFKRMLAEMAHMALTRPIMVSLGMGGMLPGGASAATGGISSGLGLLGGVGSSLIGAGGMLGGAFGGGLAGAGGLISAGNIGGLFSGAGSLLGSGNIAAGLGMSMPIIAAAVVAALGINKLTGGGLFGTSFKQTGQDLGLSLGGGDISGLITTEESRKKSLFRGTKRRTTTTGFDTTEIDAAFDQITAAISQAANTFGITGADEIIKGFAASVNINIKDKSEAEIQAAIEQWIGDTTGALVNAVFGNSLDGLQKEGEGVIDTVNRLSMNMSAVQSITKTLGLDFNLTGKAAMIASTNIVELAGGIEQLSALSSQYYQAFYSDAERQEMLMEQLTGAFSDLNIALPESRESFRAIVDGLDLTSEAGQKLFASLMQLVPGLDQYLSGVEALTNASKEAADAAIAEAKAKAEALKAQGLDLQLRLYDALGQSSEALALRRQMELEATDESLRAMLQQIYAAQDAATAQQELADAQNAAANSARDAASAARDMAQSAFSKLEQSAQIEKDKLATELDLKLSTIEKEREALEFQRDSVIDGYKAQGDAVQDYIKKLEGLSGVINDFLGQTGAAEDPFRRLTQIFNEVKGGLLPEQGDLQAALSGISSAGAGGFGSAADASFAMAVARNQASEIGKIIGGKASGAKSQVEWLEMQVTNAQEYFEKEMLRLDAAEQLAKDLHDAQVGKIDEQLSEAQKQLNALLGVDDRILTMTEAAAEFYAALESANGLQAVIGNEQIAAINRVELAVLGLGESISMAVTPAPAPMDKPFDAPIPVGGLPNVGEPVTREMIELLQELLNVSYATAKHTKTSADVLELNQYESQEAAV